MFKTSLVYIILKSANVMKCIIVPTLVQFALYNPTIRYTM